MLKPAQIEVRVRELLRKQGISEPPVRVHKIARALGATIRTEPLEDGEVSGALYRRGADTVIGINALDVEVRQRFTVAHEIGHLLLHAEPLHVDPGHQVGVVQDISGSVPAFRFLRDKVSSEAKDYREVEANRFAASLLMPQDFLAKDLRNLSIPISVANIQELAEHYKVSQQAMTFRLMNLGVPMETS